ncbi:dienelactone hydrolase family protein [Lysinibacillus sp. NPDC048646]|uniref:dienelactone hydrolase family protein n=1 Tax=Lysinibacillus sp. NPDC048646 TaxID=3390574 RepID=UPI003D0710F4
MIRKNRKIFILHEIYGVNDFIREQALAYNDAYTDVECIHFYSDEKIFSYTQEEEAYAHFTNEIGFDAPLKILARKLKTAIQQYDKVLVIGFSIGATIAWRLSTLPLHRVVCVYGSRIRQYLDLQPSCPTLILLPSHEKSFNVQDLKQALNHIQYVQTIQFPGEHGFMDCYNSAYHYESAIHAHTYIKNFI